MRFFASIKLDVHAQMIAKAFLELRREQFECSVHNIENVVGRTVSSERRILGGEADLALKGLQLLLFTRLVHRYVPTRDLQAFTGMLILAGWKAEREAVDAYCQKFHEYLDDDVELLTQVSIPISDYILGHSDPSCWFIVGRVMAIFPLSVQFMIAKEFGDKDQLVVLDEVLEKTRRELMQPPQ